MKQTHNKACYLLLFYAVFLLIFSTEIIIREYLNARRELLVASSSSSAIKSLQLSKEFWNNLKNKDEFTINGKYYDLVRLEDHKTHVTAHVIGDDFEIVLKKTVDNLSKKNSKNKKSTTLTSISLFWCEVFELKYINYTETKEKNFFKPQAKAAFFSEKVFQPPRLFQFIC